MLNAELLTLTVRQKMTIFVNIVLSQDYESVIRPSVFVLIGLF